MIVLFCSFDSMSELFDVSVVTSIKVITRGTFNMRPWYATRLDNSSFHLTMFVFARRM